MGQAASYAESSVQRALLKLKHEEQVEEDELLSLCGYARPTVSDSATSSAATAAAASLATSADAGAAHSPPPEGDAAYQRMGSSHERITSPLPPPPPSFGPFVSLTPEYYTLDELRDALRYLPDALWVSLYRVSLLYILDNDHDGRVKATDISFFMDWGIKTVGRDVPPEQLAEVLQTYAALHCWHRCLHVGEEREMEKLAQQQQQQQQPFASGRAGAGSGNAAGGGGGGGSGGGGVGNNANTAGGRPRRRNPLQSAGGPGGSSSGGHHHHHHQQSQSVASFMLLHLREAFFSRRPGAPVPLPSDTPPTMSTPSGRDHPTSHNAAGGGGGLSSPVAAVQFFSPRSAVTQPVTSTTRLEAAAHFAEWMLRLVHNQERDRRHERHHFEHRLRLIAAPEVKLCNARLRHSQYLQHHSLRLRAGSLAVFPSLGENVDGEDVIMTSQSCMPGLHGAEEGGDGEAEAEVVAMTAPRLSLPDNDVVAGLAALNNSSSHSHSTAVSGHATSTSAAAATAAAATPAKGNLSSPSSRSVTPLGSSAPLAKAQRDTAQPNNTNTNNNQTNSACAGGLGDGAAGVAAAAAPAASTTAAFSLSPQQQPNRAQPARPTGAAPNFSTSSSSRALPSFPYPSTNTSHAVVGLSDDNMLMGSSNPMREGASHTTMMSAAAAVAAAAGSPGGLDGAMNSPNWYTPAAAYTPAQVSALLMDAEPFYEELERNGWCTIGAVEEAYLDFAVEDSYCLSFWAFCRLLNEASADEVQNALDLTTAQATAVLTSAAAVEEHRRAAAIRQLQRLGGTVLNTTSNNNNNNNTCFTNGLCGGSPQRTASVAGGWERQVEVVPLFIVSEYTFVTFVTAFIHAYWDMLESMGLDAVTQPVDVTSVTTARSNTSPAFRPS